MINKINSSKKASLSIVVPVYNEYDNLRHFTAAVEKAMQSVPYAYHILFIDDGSASKSRELLRKLTKEDEHVQAIFLAHNCGHQAALTCGLDNADGDAVITMDGDMQHPPEMLPELIAKWEAGYDVVQTIRLTTEGVSLFKRLTSKYYYKFLNCISEVPIQPGGSDFRLLDRQVVKEFRRYREQDRFIRGIIGAMGYNQIQLEFVAPERYAGKSKFSLRKMAKFAMDGILGNSVVPLRISFYAGFVSLLASLLLFIHVMYETLMGDTVAGWATIMICLSFFGGTELLVLGIVGEYIGRIFRQVKARPLYLVEKEDRLHKN